MSDEMSAEAAEYAERVAEFEAELRAKYSEAERNEMAKSGEALPDGSFPIKDAQDLSSAIKLNGSGSTAKSTVRAHIKKRAAALGLSKEIPDDWREADSIPAVPKRHWSLREVEVPILADMSLRDATSDTSEATLVGWPSTTGQGYEVTDWLGEYRETINPPAFAKTLKESDYVPMLLDHKGDVLAAYRQDPTRTMDLATDSKGLRSEARIDVVDNTTSRTVASGIRRGDLSKMSFAFRATKETWNAEYTERGVDELQLFDVSVVKSPANPYTSVMLRSDMADILGRDGIATLWAAREAFAAYTTLRSLDPLAEPHIEAAMRALRSVDERMAGQDAYKWQGRARTFIVVDLMEQVRAGKTISSANETLLKSALESLSPANDSLAKVDAAVAETRTAIATTLGDTDPNANAGEKVANNAGLDTGTKNDGNPVLPNDGAGVRSIPSSVLKAQRELAALKLRTTNRKK